MGKKKTQEEEAWGSGDPWYHPVPCAGATAHVSVADNSGLLCPFTQTGDNTGDPEFLSVAKLLFQAVASTLGALPWRMFRASCQPGTSKKEQGSWDPEQTLL